MTPETESLLIAEARKYGAVDDEVVKLYDSEEPIANDPDALALAVRTLVEKHPALFNPPKGWNELEPDTEEWREREKAFREGLRQSTPIGPNAFRSLDAALLTSNEEAALKRYLGNRSDSYDRSILQNALAKQREHLGGDAA